MLDRKSPIPKYYQLKLHLQDQILSGKLAPGEKMPSEEQLAKDCGISKMTVRQALSGLVEAGLLDRKHGVGTFVARKKIQRNLVGEFVTFFESNELAGRHPSSRVLNVQVVSAEGQLQTNLNVKQGDPVVQLKRLMLLDGEPISSQTVWVPQEKWPNFMGDVYEWQSVIALFERKYHLFPVRTEQRLEAVQADATVSELLGIDVGSPLLHTERTTFLEDGDALEASETYFRSDRYFYHVTLYRRKTLAPNEEVID